MSARTKVSDNSQESDGCFLHAGFQHCAGGIAFQPPPGESEFFDQGPQALLAGHVDFVPAGTQRQRQHAVGLDVASGPHGREDDRLWTRRKHFNLRT